MFLKISEFKNFGRIVQIVKISHNVYKYFGIDLHSRWDKDAQSRVFFHNNKQV